MMNDTLIIEDLVYKGKRVQKNACVHMTQGVYLQPYKLT